MRTTLYIVLGVGAVLLGLSFHRNEIRQAMQWPIDVTATLFARVSSEIAGNTDYVAGRITQPYAWEDFASGNLQVMPSGQRWSMLPGNANTRVLPVLRDGAMTANDSGKQTTQAYASIDYGKVPSSVRAEISFSDGERGCGAALILTKTMSYTSSDAHIVDEGAVHIVFSDRKIFVGLFKSHDFFVAKTIYYPTALDLAGKRYVVGYDIVGDMIKVYAPGIDGFIWKDARVAALSGPFLTIEPFWTSGQCHPRFHAVEAS